MKSSLGKSSDMEVYYQYLVKDGYFETMKDVLLLAVIIGYRSGNRLPFSKYGGDPIKDHIFKDDMDFLNIISLLDQKDTKILLNDNKDDKYKIFEEYANAGMNELVKNIFAGQHTDPDRIIDYVMSFAPDTHEVKKNLADLFGGIIQEMEE